MNTNIITKTDSYKFTHWEQYPEGTEAVYSYFEARKGARLSPELARALEDKAVKLDRSESWVITEALKAYLFPKPRLPAHSD